MMWRWWQKDLDQPFQWSLCILMSLTLFVEACRGGCSAESKFLIQFIQAIDPENVLAIHQDGYVPECCSVMLAGTKCDMLSLNITDIRLENMNLSGKIDADSLCKIPSLQVLSLANNLLHGIIPEVILNCRSLTYLNLSRNRLHGMVPTSLSSLKNLKSLDISFTNLTGPIPQFEQEIELFIPNSMNSSTSNGKKDAAITSFKEKHDGNSRRLKGLTARWIQLINFLPLFLTLIFFSVFVFFTKNKAPKITNEKENKEHIPESPVKKLLVSREDGEEKGGEELNLVFFCENCQKFRIDELLKSAADIQGQNFHSTLYKARLTDTAVFAVKRLKNFQVPLDEFRRQFTWIGNLKHPNLLPLMAFNSAEDEKLLIYRYQENGSLSSLLSSYAQKKINFPWIQRLSVMSGIARGLDYLARESSQENLAHGNLKPSNIMLSETEEPLISEYGIWGFLDPTRAFLYSDGYRAPEKKLTKEADIFSFGVILLELLTGKIVEKGSQNLARWVKSMVREEWTVEVFDKEVRKAGNQWAFPLLNVALKCTSDRPERRPNISEVLEKIEEVVTSQEHCSFSSTSSAESN